MYKITCDYCFEENLFENPNKAPDFCTNCNTALGHLVPVEIADENSSGSNRLRIPDGFRLTYEKTGASIEIAHNDIIVLGRHSTGKEILGNIPQVSREHCKIEFFGSQYLVTDLNSLNGTFLGAARRDCLKHMKQELNDGDVLFLGREPFSIKFHYSEGLSDEILNETVAEEELHTMKFKCKACGRIHDMNLMICDNCGSYGQIELLED